MVLASKRGTKEVFELILRVEWSVCRLALAHGPAWLYHTELGEVGTVNPTYSWLAGLVSVLERPAITRQRFIARGQRQLTVGPDSALNNLLTEAQQAAQHRYECGVPSLTWARFHTRTEVECSPCAAVVIMNGHRWELPAINPLHELHWHMWFSQLGELPQDKMMAKFAEIDAAISAERERQEIETVTLAYRPHKQPEGRLMWIGSSPDVNTPLT